MGLGAVQAMARHRLARVPYVGVSRAVVQARAQRPRARLHPATYLFRFRLPSQRPPPEIVKPISVQTTADEKGHKAYLTLTARPMTLPRVVSPNRLTTQGL